MRTRIGIVAQVLLCWIGMAFAAAPEIGQVLWMPAVQAEEGELDLQDYSGKVVYLDFWASWCEPCKASFPFMQKLHEDLAEQGLVVLAVNLDRRAQKAERFLAEHKVDFQVAYDPKAASAEALELQGMPTCYLLDREGRLIFRHTGFREEDREELKDAILKELSK